MRITAGLVAGLVCTAAFAGSSAQRTLTFEERVKAQAAIERVYYSHQVGANKPFERAVPKQVLEAKVRSYLDQTAALSVYWNTRITDPMLQRELERMARDTRMPERLQELYAALGNDPFLIKECLARQTLVDRLSRNFFSFSPSLHAEAHAKAEQIRRGLSAGVVSPNSDHPNRAIVVFELAQSDVQADAADPRDRRLDVLEFRKRRGELPAGVGETSEVRESRDAFTVEVILSETPTSVRVASYSFPKARWEEWWTGARRRTAGSSVHAVAKPSLGLPVPSQRRPSNPSTVCANDFWDNAGLDDLPLGRGRFSAVWTGSVMLVWGGFRVEIDGPVNSGGRYDPATDTWAPISLVGAPAARYSHSTVWTGTRMVVWGGLDKYYHPFKTGGLYDPVTDTWTPTATDGAPSARANHTAVWTGGVMVVWGGDEAASPYRTNTGGRYDPATNTWTASSLVNAPTARVDHTAVWTGSEMIVWGGEYYSGGWHYLDTGARYNPVTDSWAATSLVGSPSPRLSHSAVWTGHVMVVWGGYGTNTGGRYDPISDTWAPTSTLNAPPSGQSSADTAVWTGSYMIVWGIFDSRDFHDQGGRYDPVADVWSSVTSSGAPSPRWEHSAVWTGSHMIVWGGMTEGNSSLNSGGRYDPQSDSWTPTSVGGAPEAIGGQSLVWTGNTMIVWGGAGDYTVNTGGRYDPATDAWTATSTLEAPSPRFGHTANWTGSEMIVWGGAYTQTELNTGGKYDPIADTWSPMSTEGAPDGRMSHTSIWTGNAMVVWGGVRSNPFSEVLDTGGRYDPATDTWSPTSLVDAPSARVGHSAVWTGSEMILWGGGPNGYRYDPSSDSWTAPISVADAPAARSGQTAVWTGTEMVVWGGTVSGGTRTNSGGRYDPANDSWAPTSLFHAAAGRIGHSMVWTGSEILIWGGAGSAGYAPAGGAYSPATDSWHPMTQVGQPALRYGHGAVWTGEQMVIWGGGFNVGGRYSPTTTVDDDCDNDGFRDADGDCDDHNSAVYPGAPQVCDGVNNNCSDYNWPALPYDEVDNDHDGFTECTGDCDDYVGPGSDGSDTYPGAPQYCDGRNTDCDDPNWPLLPPAERDADHDGWMVCNGDCDDTNRFINPGRREFCDGLDNNCDGTVDNGGNALCFDGNPCTDDVCGGAAGCTFAFNENPCNDFNACTVGDTCGAGSCHPGSPRVCDDGDVCNGLETCNVTTGCVAGSPLNCDDGAPCTIDACDPATGCSHTTTTGACDDGDPCTGGDNCATGTCIGTPVEGAPCEDGNACTSGDTCHAGICLGGGETDCEDGNVCTNDLCDPSSGCFHDPNANVCDDGNPCTLSSSCVAGVCQGSSLTDVVAVGWLHTCALHEDGLVQCWGLDNFSQVSGPSATLQHYASISGNGYNTCAVRQDGSLACWGQDWDYSINGPNQSSGVYSRVSTGIYHVCALRADGGLSCWGTDSFGQVSGPSASSDQFLTISAGAYHTCALRTDNRIRCWGSNTYGQIAGPNGSQEPFSVVVTGDSHTCGLNRDGRVRCWGYDYYGEVSGPNASTEHYTAISAGGQNTCAVRDDGRLDCWGEWSDPDEINHSYAVVAAGRYHKCALTADGRLACWGSDSYGESSGPSAAGSSFGLGLCDDSNPCTFGTCQLGVGCTWVPLACDDANPCTLNSCDPSTGACVFPPGPSGVPCASSSETACSHADTCNGEGRCAPNNVPDGTPCDDGNICSTSSTCTQGNCQGVSYSTSITTGGYYHTCAIVDDGRLACWGGDGNGQVSGPNASTDRYTQVTAGDIHTCALRVDGRIRCWGYDGWGQTSGPNNSLETYVAVAAGRSHTCGLTAVGHPRCWGEDLSGQVSGPNAAGGTFVSITAGGGHTCALGADAHPTCWGYDGDSNNKISGPNGAPDSYLQITAGGDHTCGLRWDGRLTCWGYVNDQAVTEPNGSTATYTAVSAGVGTTCARLVGGRLACWGYDRQGSVSGPNSSLDNYGAVSAGNAHTCALGMTGQLKCWGEDTGHNVSGPNGSTDAYGSGLCEDGDACTAGRCDAGSGCSQVAACDDGDPCTTDSCASAGSCVHTPAPSGTACGDSEETACTHPDSCDGAGHCLLNHSPDGTVCDDSDGCTTSTTCRQGICEGTSVSTSLALGVGHTCAIGGRGRLTCWGSNSVEVSGPNGTTRNFTAITAGNGRTCGLRDDQRLVCWGVDDVVPNGATTTYLQASAGDRHTCAVRGDKRLVCWGTDIYGEISGPNASTANYTYVSSALYHTCALREDGRLACWGSDAGGCVSGPNANAESFVAVGAGGYETCALRANGRISCWGPDLSGSVSDPNASTETYRAIAVGYYYACALTWNGRIRCWGDDDYGQVSGPNGSSEIFSALAAGLHHTCGLRKDHRIECWGTNYQGEVTGPNGSTSAYGSGLCDDANSCTDDSCAPATGACSHVVDDTNACSDGTECTRTDTCHAGSCSGTDVVDCSGVCPQGSVLVEGGCAKHYDIGVSLLDNLPTACDVAGESRYSDCNGPYGFHWMDSDASAGLPLGVKVQFEAGINCSGYPSRVYFNGVPVTEFPPLGDCSCESPHGTIALNELAVGIYRPGEVNTIAIQPYANCEGLNATPSLGGHFATVTVTHPVPGGPCVAGACEPATGDCVYTPQPDGTSCNDGDSCTTGDACVAGDCVAGLPTDCDDGNACTVDTCSPSVGCTHAPVLCAARDSCHDAGVCDPATGVCSNPVRPDGTACDDNDLCTTGDACRAGACTPASNGLDNPKPEAIAYWKSLCAGPHTGDQLTDADATCVAAVTRTFGDMTTVAQLCAEFKPALDPCAASEDQLLVLALNICRGKVCTAQRIDSRCDGKHSVGQSLSESDDIFSSGARDAAACEHAKCLDEEINSGRALELNSLTLTREGSSIRLDWRPPVVDGGTGPPRTYDVWRRLLPSQESFTKVGVTTAETFLDTSAVGGSYQYEVTAVMN